VFFDIFSHFHHSDFLSFEIISFGIHRWKLLQRKSQLARKESGLYGGKISTLHFLPCLLKFGINKTMQASEVSSKKYRESLGDDEDVAGNSNQVNRGSDKEKVRLHLRHTPLTKNLMFSSSCRFRRTKARRQTHPETIEPQTYI